MSQTNFQKANQLSICSGNCLRRISPLAQCKICEDTCPAHTLSFHDDHWEAVNCSLCGLCTMVCPTQVFQIDGARLSQYQKNQPLQLCCAQNSAAPADALRINCLQQLHPFLVFYLLYQHPQITIYLRPAQCQQCEHHWYAQGLVQQLSAYHIPEDQLRIVLQQPETSVSAAENQPEENQRRGFFRQLFRQTEIQSQKMVAHTVDKWTSTFSSVETTNEQSEVFPVRLPLYALYLKKQLPISADSELPFRQLECTTCHFCSACVHICPTKALTILKQESEQSLRFQPELCVNCNLCQSVCMPHGLQWGDFMTQKQFLQTPQTLAYSKEKLCTACHHEFYQWPESDDTLCRFCQP